MTATTTIVGNLTRDPELKYSGSGVAFAKFSLAVTKFKKGKNGAEDEKTPHYFDFTAFGELAENVSESLNQGDSVIVSGEPDYNSWETQDGEKRSKIAFIAKSVGPDLSHSVVSVGRAGQLGKAPQARKGSGGPSQQSRPQASPRNSRNDNAYYDEEAPF